MVRVRVRPSTETPFNVMIGSISWYSLGVVFVLNSRNTPTSPSATGLDMITFIQKMVMLKPAYAFNSLLSLNPIALKMVK